MKKVALLGLGTMGTGMAKRLLHAGFPTAVYNRTLARAEALRADGALVCKTPAEAAAEADVVISMLADDAASSSAWLGEHGALSAMRAGALAVDCGTVTPSWIEQLNAAAADKEVSVVDAPVTGSRTQAAAGELTFLAGGTDAAIAEVTPVLSAMGKKVVHAGPSGSGARLKLINNFLCAVQLTSLAEAVGWMETAGMNMDLALEVLTTGTPGSPMLKTMSQRMMKRDYEVNFYLHLLAKDVRYARADAAEAKVQLLTSEGALHRLEKSIEAGSGDKDMSSVVEQLRS